MYRNEEEVRRAARRTWGLYLLILAGWVVAVLLLALLGFLVCSGVTWYESSPLYHLMRWVRDYIVFVCMATVLVGWVAISYLFIGRLVRDTQMVLAGAEQLAQPDQAPIRLPANLKNLEDQLNLVRERALRDAQAAREAEQRKNDLVVYLAHDLKTPLTSVIGYLTLLRDEPDLSAETRARYTGVVLDKAERLEDLINEFFDITRFNLSQLELELRDVDLKRMLEQVVSEFGPVLRENGMTCELDLPLKLRAVCDPDKMARVFDNLLNNACHYAYPNSVLHVAGQQEGERIVLTFRNAGRTIPPEKLERMFERFFRLDSSRGTRSGNAGLGLAIAREIVEAHGGTIHARSADEQVIFTVILPAEGRV
ncbi:sensor histidine kinase [Intestinimonas massiliensis (ex Afouda et al. 2020)]|uniref:sensor histidine kinase n=1 Tax=Intestinimonas massiliensis (ex Afouda et al. 2020) TaxID=1673721 RepID=UPI00103092C8|nr:HAMP domain-containing sensor histidine kinase [Intestinimonas massiliensis (ex Afouda et al. 2020)]